MAYKYGGKIHDLDTPIHIAVKPEPGPSKHFPRTNGCGDAKGKTAGYKRHKRAGEEACAPCRRAVAEYSQEFRTRVRNGHEPGNRFVADRCGTPAGYWRHYRYNIPACDPCHAAYLAYMDAYRAKRRAEKASA